jgi:hypothetical protein
LSLDKLLAFGKKVRKKRVGATPLNPAASRFRWKTSFSKARLETFVQKNIAFTA